MLGNLNSSSESGTPTIVSAASVLVLKVLFVGSVRYCLIANELTLFMNNISAQGILHNAGVAGSYFSSFLH